MNPMHPVNPNNPNQYYVLKDWNVGKNRELSYRLPLLASLKASIRNNQTAFISLQPVGTVFTGLHIMDDGWGHFSFGAAGWKTVVHALHLDIGDSILLEINSVTRANGVEFLMQIRRMDGQVHAWQPPPVPAPVPTPIPSPEQTPPPAPSDSQDETSDSDVSSDSSDSQDAPTDSSGDDGDDDDVVEVDADGNEIVDDDADYNSDYDPEEIVEGTQDAPIVLD